ncbi:hypothetical protein ACQY0O_001170 [Thecaphora frezii]
MSFKPKRPQLGKIKQWSSGIGAKLAGGSSADPSHKQDLFGEIEQRGIGNSNLYAATEAYWSFLAKKKPIPFDASTLNPEDSASVSSGTLTTKPDSKRLPIEAMGLAMTSYGSLFADGSAYGACLTKLGEAHIKLGSLQAAFAKDTSNIFLSRMARFKTAIEAFHAAVKKLDAATAKLETAQIKVQKSKKEKRELEEELRLAKAAYDEAVSDVEARADAIQDSEHDDLECLTTYMQAHLDYLAQAQEVLEQASSSVSHDARNAATRRPVPLSRPRSASSIRPAPPALPRRASAKESNELNLNRSTSRLTTSSSTSNTPSEKHRIQDGPGGDGTDTGGESTAKRSDREKRNRLRMPSFSAASDTVSSMASGIGSFGRSKSSSFFSTSTEAHSSEKEPNEGGSSKWSFRGRSRKESGFKDLDASDDLRSQHREAEQVHNRISPEDVDLGLGETDVADVLSTGPSSRLTALLSDSRAATDQKTAGSNHDSAADESPFSPTAQVANTFTPLHEQSIHERGESGLGMDMPMDTQYLGVTGQPGHVDVHHTGLSAYSDGGDPFSNGAHGLLSPQGTGMSTGQMHTDYDDGDEHDDQTALTGEGRRRTTTGGSSGGGGWARSLPFAGGGRDYRHVGGKTASSGDGASFSMTSSGNGSTRPPPPPVPSSSTFLNKVKAKQKPPPPLPPPLPVRTQSGLP